MAGRSATSANHGRVPRHASLGRAQTWSGRRPRARRHGRLRDLWTILSKRFDWDPTRSEVRAAWERGEKDRFYPYGKSYVQVFRVAKGARTRSRRASTGR